MVKGNAKPVREDHGPDPRRERMSVLTTGEWSSDQKKKVRGRKRNRKEEKKVHPPPRPHFSAMDERGLGRSLMERKVLGNTQPGKESVTPVRC